MNNYIPKRGDIVKCNYDFDEERKMYKLNYPKKDQYLTVSKITKVFPSEETVLFFEDLNISIPLAIGRFELVQTEADGDVILNEAFKTANNL